MFALEIGFQDGVSRPVMVFERRPQAIVGGTEYAHVFVEDMRALNFQLRLLRELGRRFRCKAVGVRDETQGPKNFEGVYDGTAFIDLGPVKLNVTALDSDLIVRDGEPPDRAGVRVLRQVCATSSPLFPAVVVRGSTPLVVSFVNAQPIYIGRSKQCALRLDAADVSARHARMGYENGEFWIEDLGSTNGTFVNQQQISGRVSVPAGVPIVLGREISIFGVTSEDQIARAASIPSEMYKVPAAVQDTYPVLLAISEVARPARLVIQPGSTIKIGRDPVNDMWLGAPHVSRHHCSVIMTRDGSLSILDQSTNGTAYDGGVMKRGDSIDVPDQPMVLDFGGNITVAVCFNQEQEQAFAASHGAVNTFIKDKQPPRPDPARELAEVVGTLAGLNVGEGRDVGETRRSFVERLVRLYRSLSIFGRVMLLFIAVALPLLAAMVLSLIVPLLR
ncbi:MAG: FHA domain-containing protein [Oligoflexia bacterium]|nr:FHA domain-containing protein [Oligoflexia bacterium]